MMSMLRYCMLRPPHMSERCLCSFWGSKASWEPSLLVTIFLLISLKPVLSWACISGRGVTLLTLFIEDCIGWAGDLGSLGNLKL